MIAEQTIAYEEIQETLEIDASAVNFILRDGLDVRKIARVGTRI